LTAQERSSARRRCALIVDFDNIFLGLRAIDMASAERFATEPGRWLRWIDAGMPGGEEEVSPAQPDRSLLIRRCYLNPNTFHSYRPYFTRSAFSVIDCPPLTTQGKTSSDIQMVMDILDILERHEHIEEFIIFSGDADFTPVLFRLRAHDRRTTVLTVGPAAAAYTSACDLVITEDRFIEDGLGISSERPENGYLHPSLANGGVSPAVLLEMAQNVYEEASTNGEILPTELPRLYKDFPEFRPESNWLGFGTLRGLTRAIVGQHPELQLIEGDPWKVEVRRPTRSPSGSTASGTAESPGTDLVSPRSEEPGIPASEIKHRIIEHVRQLVFEADAPVVMAKAAHAVIRALGPQVTESHWDGEGTFKDLLLSAEGRGFEVFTAPESPGYLYDPERHQLPAQVSQEQLFEDLAPDLVAFMHRMHQVTDAPLLHPREYAVVFTSLADDLWRHPFNPFVTSKYVRDLCIESGKLISRTNVLAVLRGLSFTEHDFGEHPEGDHPRRIAALYRDYLLAQAESARLDLSAEEKQWLGEWVLGGFSSSSVPWQGPEAPEESESPVPEAAGSTADGTADLDEVAMVLSGGGEEGSLTSSADGQPPEV